VTVYDVKVAFLLHNAYAVGGTVRTTLNLAGALTEAGHDVEVVSMMRHRGQPRLAPDARVRVRPLVDTRAGSADLGNPLLSEPARDYPASDKRHRQYSRLHDERARAYLSGCTADVIVGTRPGLNVYLARFGPRRALRVGQEHLRHDAHSPKLRRVLADEYRALDAVVTTTRADAEVYRARMRLPGVRVEPVPNIVPPVVLPPSAGGAPVVAAAGRLVRGKRYDLLIQAFAKVAAQLPDWQLRIYGGGPEKDALQQLVHELGLSGRALLMGVCPVIEEEFAKASLVAVTSDAESFGMTLVEAMRCGVPVVSTDAPLGPREIVRDGVDGLLVPCGDAGALAAALLELMEDAPRRRAMGEAALAGAHRYDAEPIVRRYELLFAELEATRGARAYARVRTRVADTARRRFRRVRGAVGRPVRWLRGLEHGLSGPGHGRRGPEHGRRGPGPKRRGALP
jgi:glycosyltransferase involved in cell wall biosynthesis